LCRWVDALKNAVVATPALHGRVRFVTLSFAAGRGIRPGHPDNGGSIGRAAAARAVARAQTVLNDIETLLLEER
jgi:hypothetical protein